MENEFNSDPDKQTQEAIFLAKFKAQKLLITY